jgi:hypothetical protein
MELGIIPGAVGAGFPGDMHRTELFGPQETLFAMVIQRPESS